MYYPRISELLKSEYGQKIYRLSLQSGCSCPNRDGTLGTGGCTFCSAGGSGDFAAPLLPLEEQLLSARRRVDAKIPSGIPPEKRLYIAYFQSFTNTWGDRNRLQSLYRRTIERPEICILSVGTRPDCLDRDWIQFFSGLNRIKPVWLELGLQTSCDKTAEAFHRGYAAAVYDKAYAALKAAGLTVITHLILGLPGESREMILQSVRHVTGLYRQYQNASGGPDIRSDGVKLQLLHVLRGTRMAEEYAAHPFRIFTPEEYADLVTDCLKLLAPQTVVHRITGDGPKKLLIAPLWSADKKRILNLLNRRIAEA